MHSLVQILMVAPAMLAVANAQGVITKAQGTGVASTGFQVQNLATDANIINPAEISANIVNGCGRTILAGNIDIGAVTEDLLANKTVTSVTKGSKVAVTINQKDATGGGPYTCTLDQTSNAGAFEPITSKETDPSSTTGDITLEVDMPANLNCVGASTGNVCTVKCVNTNAAGPFGGCFAVQQTDITPVVNAAATITTAAGLSAIKGLVITDSKQLPAALQQVQDSSLADEPVNVVTTLAKALDKAVVAAPAAAVASPAASPATSPAASSGSTAKGSSGKGSGTKAASNNAKGTGKNNRRSFSA